MHLKFYKVSEDTATVKYQVETNAYEKTAAGVIKTLVKALCIYDKATKKVSFDHKKTDSFFFDRTWEAVMIEMHLQDISKKDKGFPETSSITTGG